MLSILTRSYLMHTRNYISYINTKINLKFRAKVYVNCHNIKLDTTQSQSRYNLFSLDHYGLFFVHTAQRLQEELFLSVQ